MHIKESFYVEFEGKQIEGKQLFDRVKESWKAEGKKVKDIKTIQLYYKPGEGKFYSVVNGEDEGSYEV